MRCSARVVRRELYVTPLPVLGFGVDFASIAARALVPSRVFVSWSPRVSAREFRVVLSDRLAAAAIAAAVARAAS